MTHDNAIDAEGLAPPPGACRVHQTALPSSSYCARCKSRRVRIDGFNRGTCSGCWRRWGAQKPASGGRVFAFADDDGGAT